MAFRNPFDIDPVTGNPFGDTNLGHGRILDTYSHNQSSQGYQLTFTNEDNVSQTITATVSISDARNSINLNSAGDTLSLTLYDTGNSAVSTRSFQNVFQAHNNPDQFADIIPTGAQGGVDGFALLVNKPTFYHNTDNDSDFIDSRFGREPELSAASKAAFITFEFQEAISDFTFSMIATSDFVYQQSSITVISRQSAADTLADLQEGRAEIDVFNPVVARDATGSLGQGSSFPTSPSNPIDLTVKAVSLGAVPNADPLSETSVSDGVNANQLVSRTYGGTNGLAVTSTNDISQVESSGTIEFYVDPNNNFSNSTLVKTDDGLHIRQIGNNVIVTHNGHTLMTPFTGTNDGLGGTGFHAVHYQFEPAQNGTSTMRLYFGGELAGERTVNDTLSLTRGDSNNTAQNEQIELSVGFDFDSNQFNSAGSNYSDFFQGQIGEFTWYQTSEFQGLDAATIDTLTQASEALLSADSTDTEITVSQRFFFSEESVQTQLSAANGGQAVNSLDGQNVLVDVLQSHEDFRLSSFNEVVVELDGQAIIDDVAVTQADAPPPPVEIALNDITQTIDSLDVSNVSPGLVSFNLYDALGVSANDVSLSAVEVLENGLYIGTGQSQFTIIADPLIGNEFTIDNGQEFANDWIYGRQSPTDNFDVAAFISSSDTISNAGQTFPVPNGIGTIGFDFDPSGQVTFNYQAMVDAFSESVDNVGFSNFTDSFIGGFTNFIKFEVTGEAADDANVLLTDNTFELSIDIDALQYFEPINIPQVNTFEVQSPTTFSVTENNAGVPSDAQLLELLAASLPVVTDPPGASLLGVSFDGGNSFFDIAELDDPTSNASIAFLNQLGLARGLSAPFTVQFVVAGAEYTLGDVNANPSAFSDAFAGLTFTPVTSTILAGVPEGDPTIETVLDLNAARVGNENEIVLNLGVGGLEAFFNVPPGGLILGTDIDGPGAGTLFDLSSANPDLESATYDPTSGELRVVLGPDSQSVSQLFIDVYDAGSNSLQATVGIDVTGSGQPLSFIEPPVEIALNDITQTIDLLDVSNVSTGEVSFNLYDLLGVSENDVNLSSVEVTGEGFYVGSNFRFFFVSAFDFFNNEVVVEDGNQEFSFDWQYSRPEQGLGEVLIDSSSNSISTDNGSTPTSISEIGFDFDTNGDFTFDYQSMVSAFSASESIIGFSDFTDALTDPFNDFLTFEVTAEVADGANVVLTDSVFDFSIDVSALQYSEPLSVPVVEAVETQSPISFSVIENNTGVPSDTELLELLAENLPIINVTNNDTPEATLLGVSFDGGNTFFAIAELDDPTSNASIAFIDQLTLARDLSAPFSIQFVVDGADYTLGDVNANPSAFSDAIAELTFTPVTSTILAGVPEGDPTIETVLDLNAARVGNENEIVLNLGVGGLEAFFNVPPGGLILGTDIDGPGAGTLFDLSSANPDLESATYDPTTGELRVVLGPNSQSVSELYIDVFEAGSNSLQGTVGIDVTGSGQALSFIEPPVEIALNDISQTIDLLDVSSVGPGEINFNLYDMLGVSASDVNLSTVQITQDGSYGTGDSSEFFTSAFFAIGNEFTIDANQEFVIDWGYLRPSQVTNNQDVVLQSANNSILNEGSLVPVPGGIASIGFDFDPNGDFTFDYQAMIDAFIASESIVGFSSFTDALGNQINDLLTFQVTAQVADGANVVLTDSVFDFSIDFNALGYFEPETIPLVDSVEIQSPTTFSISQSDAGVPSDAELLELLAENLPIVNVTNNDTPQAALLGVSVDGGSSYVRVADLSIPGSDASLAFLQQLSLARNGTLPYVLQFVVGNNTYTLAQVNANPSAFSDAVAELTFTPVTSAVLAEVSQGDPAIETVLDLNAARQGNENEIVLNLGVGGLEAFFNVPPGGLTLGTDIDGPGAGTLFDLSSANPDLESATYDPTSGELRVELGPNSQSISELFIDVFDASSNSLQATVGIDVTGGGGQINYFEPVVITLTDITATIPELTLEGGNTATSFSLDIFNEMGVSDTLVSLTNVEIDLPGNLARYRSPGFFANASFITTPQSTDITDGMVPFDDSLNLNWGFSLNAINTASGDFQSIIYDSILQEYRVDNIITTGFDADPVVVSFDPDDGLVFDYSAIQTALFQPGAPGGFNTLDEQFNNSNTPLVFTFTAELDDPNSASFANGINTFDVTFDINRFVFDPTLVGGGGQPLLIDMDGNGFDIEQGNAHIHLTDNATTVAMSWLQGADAWVAYDVNNDGLASVEEITLTQYAEGAQSDLHALALGFDSNEDGIVDNLDDKFDDLLLWVDNGNGLASASEVMTLAEAGVVSLGLDYTGDGYQFEGGTIVGTAVVTLTDGSTLSMADLSLEAQSVEPNSETATVSVSNLSNLLSESGPEVVTLTDNTPVNVSTWFSGNDLPDSGQGADTLDW